MAAAVAERGIEVFGKHGVSMEEYEALLAETLKCHPHIIIDDGCSPANAKSTPAASSAAARKPLPASCASRPGSGKDLSPAP